MIPRLVLAALLAALAAAVVVSLPPQSRALGAVPASFGPVARGAVHIHTKRSDGSGSVDDVAAAAGQAGLHFVVITDHGDASRAPDPPSYRSGVLCIDAVEISTEQGHLVALGLPAAPYPLGGEGRDVVEDVARLGGFGIAAHPVSPRQSSRWTEWTAPFGGIEWLNGDSEWRDERAAALGRSLIAYPFRAAESVARLLDRSDVAMSRWDALTQRRRVVAVAASDAHARVGLRDEDHPVQGRVALSLPGYASVFKAFSIAVPGVALTGRADADARAIVDAIRGGHVYSLVDGIAKPGALRFTASSGRNTASGGDFLALDGPVRLSAAIHGPAHGEGGARLVLLKNGARIAESTGTSLEHTADDGHGVFRLEVYVAGSSGQPQVPWIVSNPIYARMPDAQWRPPAPPPATTRTPLDSGMASWTVEQNPTSKGAVNVISAVGGGRQALFRFALSGTPSASPYVAMVIPDTSGIAGHDRLTFRIRADRPMRVSVQFRRHVAGTAGDRWHRSVYVGETPRTVTVAFNETSARAGAPQGRLPVSEIGSILFAVDSVNTRIGTSGQIAIDQVTYER